MSALIFLIFLAFPLIIGISKFPGVSGLENWEARKEQYPASNFSRSFPFDFHVARERPREAQRRNIELHGCINYDRLDFECGGFPALIIAGSPFNHPTHAGIRSKLLGSMEQTIGIGWINAELEAHARGRDACNGTFRV